MYDVCPKALDLSTYTCSEVWTVCHLNDAILGSRERGLLVCLHVGGREVQTSFNQIALSLSSTTDHSSTKSRQLLKYISV